MWNVVKEAIWVRQSNGWSTEFRLALNGHILSGSVLSCALPEQSGFNLTGVDVEYMRGTLDGTLVESALTINVRFADTVGVYDLVIDEFGGVSGTPHDFEKPGSRADVIGMTRLERTWSPTPPVPEAEPFRPEPWEPAPDQIFVPVKTEPWKM